MSDNKGEAHASPLFRLQYKRQYYLLLLMILPHALSKLLDMSKVFHHHPPSIPVGIIRIDMEKCLVGPHPVFHIHLEQNLVYV